MRKITIEIDGKKQIVEEGSVIEVIEQSRFRGEGANPYPESKKVGYFLRVSENYRQKTDTLEKNIEMGCHIEKYTVTVTEDVEYCTYCWVDEIKSIRKLK